MASSENCPSCGRELPEVEGLLQTCPHCLFGLAFDDPVELLPRLGVELGPAEHDRVVAANLQVVGGELQAALVKRKRLPVLAVPGETDGDVAQFDGERTACAPPLFRRGFKHRGFKHRDFERSAGPSRTVNRKVGGARGRRRLHHLERTRPVGAPREENCLGKKELDLRVRAISRKTGFRRPQGFASVSVPSRTSRGRSKGCSSSTTKEPGSAMSSAG